MPSTTAKMKRTQIWGKEKDRDKERLVGAGGALRGEQVGQPGVARGLNGGWRRSVVRSRAARGGQGEIAPRSWWRSILRHHASPSPPPTYLPLASRYERAKLDSLSLRHEAEGGIVEPENADHLGLGRVRALTPSPSPSSCKNCLLEGGKNVWCHEKHATCVPQFVAA